MEKYKCEVIQPFEDNNDGVSSLVEKGDNIFLPLHQAEKLRELGFIKININEIEKKNTAPVREPYDLRADDNNELSVNELCEYFNVDEAVFHTAEGKQVVSEYSLTKSKVSSTLKNDTKTKALEKLFLATQQKLIDLT